GDRHHERVERVLRAHEARVEEPERRRHHQDERGCGEHPGRVARVHLGDLCQHQRVHYESTGVTAPWSVSPVRMRTARSIGRTKILQSPTSPVRAPSQRASIVGWTNVSETAISKRTFSESPIFTVVPRYVSTRSS